MSIKEQVRMILTRSRQTELEFLDSLSEEDREEIGRFEDWSAKDVVAHTSYWIDLCADQVNTWVQEQKVEPTPGFERANKENYAAYAESSWEEVRELSERAHTRLADALEGVDEAVLHDRSYASEGRPLWRSILQTAYSHKLTHLAEYHSSMGQPDRAGAMWSEWAQLMSPLDADPEWQGTIHYNAACGLALAGDPDRALIELDKSLKLQPGLKPWSRLDSDLEILHDDPEFKRMIATEDWWRALEAGPEAEAMADQFLRTLAMFREAVSRFDEAGWREGETDYLRPASLALHATQTIALFSSLGIEDSAQDPLLDVNWQDPDESALPSQEALLALLDRVELRLARFLSQAELSARETQYPYAGSTLLSRAAYCLRHTQHHLADMATELQRRGLKPPGWA